MQIHSNAYDQAGTNVLIKVYSTDIGGTQAGTVSKVEFYNGTTKSGQDLTPTNNAYSHNWQSVNPGVYTIKAVATNGNGIRFKSTGVKFTIGTAIPIGNGMSACKGKYLANISSTRGTSIRSDYDNYWNGMTSEDYCKWGLVEGTRAEYILDKKINKSKALLKDSPAPITQIAYVIGFEGYSNFCAAFKKIVSITPEQYRKKYQ